MFTNNKNKISVLVIILISVIFFILQNTGQITYATSFKKDAVSIRIKKLLKEKNINGIVLINGSDSNPKVISNTCNIDNPTQLVDKNHYFPIASLQKIMTSYLIYKLVNKGQINYNTPLSKYYPEIKYSNKITVNQLMCHQSGIMDENIIPNKIIFSENSRIKYLLSHINVSKNKHWNYASANYGLLASMVKSATHQTYYQNIKKYILIPNGVTNIEPFNDVFFLNNIILPVKPGRKKAKILQHILQFYLTFNEPLFYKINMAFYLWCNLAESLSPDFGAGDFLASPQDYWTVINNNLLKHSAFSNAMYKRSLKTEKKYFGGLYFRKNYMYANGVTDSNNSCYFIANRKNKKMLMLFTNNVNYLSLKEIQNELNKIYFDF